MGYVGHFQMEHGRVISVTAYTGTATIDWAVEHELAPVKAESMDEFMSKIMIGRKCTRFIAVNIYRRGQLSKGVYDCLKSSWYKEGELNH